MSPMHVLLALPGDIERAEHIGDCQLIAQLAQQNQPPALESIPIRSTATTSIDSTTNRQCKIYVRRKLTGLTPQILQDCVVQLERTAHCFSRWTPLSKSYSSGAEFIHTHQNLKRLARPDSASLVSAHARVTPRQQISGSSVRGKTRLCKTGNGKQRRGIIYASHVSSTLTPCAPGILRSPAGKGKAGASN